MNDDTPIPEIAEIFHGVEDEKEPVHTRFVLERWLHDPPSYMVRLALGCAGFKIYRSGDKSVWGVNVRFEDIPFSITDWKRQSWEIASVEKSGEVLAAAERLKKKISQAAQRLDKMIVEWGKSLVAEGKFFVSNTYPKVRGAYEHFRHAMEEAAAREVTEEEEQPAASPATVSNADSDEDATVTITLDVEMTRRLNAEFRRRSDVAYTAMPQ